MKTALITGITGQDGAYLAQFLINKGYTIYGTYRRVSTPNFWRLHNLKIFDKINLLPMDLLDSASIDAVLKQTDPSEIYHLAAQSFVAVSFQQPLYTTDVTGLGVTRILDSILKHNKKIKFYQASSSEMFGKESSKIKNEKTPFFPTSPYAIAKLCGFWTSTLYRDAYSIFTSNGICFNHESPLRGLEFVSRKISNGVARISLGLQKDLKLGNLNAVRDWGYAPEYVEGMWSTLQQKTPDDYVFATNESHTVKEFVEESCKIAGISINKIKSSKSYFRPSDVEHLQGDFKKAEVKLGWKPKIKFKKLVKIMVEEDLKRWTDWSKSNPTYWDAIMND